MYLFILFLAVLGLHRCTGFTPVAVSRATLVPGLFTAVASLG